MPEASTTWYVGKYRRGDAIRIGVVCGDYPIEAPIVDFWLNATTKIGSVRLPQRRDLAFGDHITIGPEFIDSHYMAVIRYDYGIYSFAHFVYFEVIGGVGKGPVVGVHELRRPLGRAVVTVNEDGTANMGYNPRAV